MRLILSKSYNSDDVTPLSPSEPFISCRPFRCSPFLTLILPWADKKYRRKCDRRQKDDFKTVMFFSEISFSFRNLTHFFFATFLFPLTYSI